MQHIWELSLNYLTTAGYIALCLLLFSIAIAIHEFGHFIVALKLGLNVERFSIGFGPAIWKKVYKGVEYRISWIPLGGYVSIPDVDPEGTKIIEGEGAKKKERIPAWKEILVSVAGPGMNIVLAVIIAVILSLVPSAKFGETPAIVDGFSLSLEDDGSCPAEKAGMKFGDKIIEVGGNKVNSWSDMQTEIQLADEKPTLFKVERGDEIVELTVTPRRDKVTGACFIGVLKSSSNTLWMPARNPLKQLAWDAGSIFRVLKGLVSPKEAAATGKALGGPVMIAEGIYKSTRNDICDGLGFLRFLNVNLAVINLLPIPVLDGGLILFALIALIFRRRVPDKIVNIVSTGFMILLMGLMALLIFRDVMRSVRIHTYEPPKDARAAIWERRKALGLGGEALEEVEAQEAQAAAGNEAAIEATPINESPIEDAPTVDEVTKDVSEN